MPTKVRTVRVGELWEEALAIAEKRGDTLTAVIIAALERYARRHRQP